MGSTELDFWLEFDKSTFRPFDLSMQGIWNKKKGQMIICPNDDGYIYKITIRNSQITNVLN